VSSAKHSNRGLGKGMDALLSQDFDTSLLIDPEERIQKLAVNIIQPNQDQPRRHFDETALQQLAESIEQYGILQPLVVKSQNNGEYQIVAGERRWRAAQKAGFKTVPVIVRSTQELEQLEIALVENVQRVDLSPLEQAVSIERLHQQFSLTYDAIAKRLSKAVSTINNIVRLLQLPEEARLALQEQHITEGHARQILALKNHANKQLELLNLIIKNNWSVREAERFVTAFKASAPDVKVQEVQAKIRSETPETKKLSKKFGTPVSIRRTARGGKLANDVLDLYRAKDT
jgi:ParB family chromosome partitioning protein